MHQPSQRATPAIDIVPAQLADAGDIARILVSCWHTVYASILTPAQLAQIVVPKQQARHEKMLNAGTRYFKAVEHGETIGFTSFGRSRFPIIADELELYTIYITPTKLRLGIGQRLLDTVLADPAVVGRSIGLLSLAHNPCRSFYDKNGFTVAGAEEHDSHGRMETFVYYTRRLPG